MSKKNRERRTSKYATGFVGKDVAEFLGQTKPSQKKLVRSVCTYKQDQRDIRASRTYKD